MKITFFCLFLTAITLVAKAGDAPVIKHRFLALDESRAQLVFVDQQNPSQGWTIKLPVKARDFQLIGNHQILLNGHDGYTIYDLNTRALVKQLHDPKYKDCDSVRRLANGHTYIGCNHGGITVYELGADDTLISTASFPTLRILRLMRFSPSNTLLMGANIHLAVEVDMTGKILNQFPLPAPAQHIYQVLRLANGNLLASGGYGHFLAEIDPSGKVTTRNDGVGSSPEINPHFWANFQILKNGHIVQCNWTGHGAQDSSKGTQLVEFDAAGKVVWSWHDAQLAGTIHGVIILDDINPEVLNDDISGILQAVQQASPPPVTLIDVEKAMDLARRTLVFVEKTAPRPAFSAELQALAQRVEQVHTMSSGDLPLLLSDIRATRRCLIFSHPLLAFEKLLINKNPPTTYSHNCDQYLGRHSRVGEGPAILEDWKSGNPKETVLLKGKLPEGGFWHPALSYDAKKFLFTYADHTSKDSRQWRYLLYEAAIDGSSLRQLTGTPQDSQKTWRNRETVLVEDCDPCYLPDGGIVFISTRSQNFGRCHGGRYVPSFLLYRCEGDGSNIRQLSWGEANEATPAVLEDGRIVYTRWDYVDRNEMEFHKLWTNRPDGTSPSNFYGTDTIAPLMISEVRTIPNTGKIVATGMAHHSFNHGSVVVIDPDKGENGPEPLSRITPEVDFPETQYCLQQEQELARARHLPEPNAPLPKNFSSAYASPYPLSEDLFLVAYSPQPITMQGHVPPTNSFGIYLLDSLGGRELIYKDPKVSCFSPTPVQPVPMPPILPSSLPLANDNKGSETGTYLIQNVYLTRNDPQGLIKPGQIKSLRFNELINKPAASSAPVNATVPVELPKRILGTVPVNPDGSVAVIVPAKVPLQIQALDKNGMAIMTERTFHYLQPGEVRSCVGCHEPVGSAPPPSRSLARSRPVPLTPNKGVENEGGLSFARTVQPVLDRYCIECHGLNGKKEKNVSLTGELNMPGPGEKKPWPLYIRGYSASYLALLPFRTTIGGRGNTWALEMNISRPFDYYSHGSRLMPLLRANHAKVQLDKESFARLVDWLDMNAQAYGDYSFNRVEDRVANPAGEKALREYLNGRFGQALASQPFAALVNVAEPRESRVLMAPLAVKAGGWGQIKKGGWKTTSNPDYIKATQLVEASITPLAYHDIDGTCGRPQCICGSCWVRLLKGKGTK